MRALVLESLDTLPVFRELEQPTPKSGEALVRLRAGALNRRDLWITQGAYPGLSLPIILGSDGCGIVEAVADEGEDWLGRRVILEPGLGWGGDERFQSGDYQILGMPHDGTFAEYITVPVANLFAAPEHLNDTEAAALPLAGVTAWRALVSRAALQRGERVLVTGAGGGVALCAVQLAVALGAEVYVTSGEASKLERIDALGVAGGVNYREEGWSAALRALVPGGFDVIVDSAGGDGFGQLVRMLAPGGRLAFYGGTCGKWPAILPQHLFFKQVSILASTMGSPRDFAAMYDCVREHRLIPTVDRVFPLAEGAAAFSYLASGAQLGKVLIDCSQP